MTVLMLTFARHVDMKQHRSQMIRITSDFVVSLQLCITSFAIRVVQNNLTISANNAEQSGSLQTCASFVFVYNIFPHAIRGFAVWRAFLLKKVLTIDSTLHSLPCALN
jgi:hypothetical protein